MNYRVKQLMVFIGIYALLETVSWTVYGQTWWTSIAAGAVGLGVLIWAWKKPWIAGLASLAELLVGGKGYLLSLHIGGVSVSIRMILYVVLGVIALKCWWSGQREIQKEAWAGPAILAGWVAFATIIGLAHHYSKGAVWYDVNAFLFLAVFPWWWITIRTAKDWREKVSALIAAALIIIAVKSWLLVVLFGQDHTWLTRLYRWIRNTGVGEVTAIYGQMNRVFMQSQIYSLLGSFYFLSGWLTKQAPRKVLWPLGAGIFGMIISLSRSFWLGLAIGLAVYVILTIRQWRRWWRLWPVIAVAVVSFGLYSWAMNFPSILPHDQGQRNAILSRISSADAMSSSTARINQIQPLLTAISKSPVIGEGFGKSVTYFSTDPRVKGWRTTTAFELGYLDWWLKMGFIGIGILLWWLVVIAKRTFRSIYRENLLTSLVALAGVHLTTPYLNHPLGIGWLAIIILFVYAADEK
jgi:hypothetical protein